MNENKIILTGFEKLIAIIFLILFALVCIESTYIIISNQKTIDNIDILTSTVNDLKEVQDK